MKPEFFLGQKVHFSKGYPRKCCRRFAFAQQGVTYQPTPDRGEGEGLVVGTRVVIMTDAKERGGYSSFDGEATPCYFTGKRETVLLVTQSIKKEPFIVRITELL